MSIWTILLDVNVSAWGLGLEGDVVLLPLRWMFHERRTYILPSRPVVMSHGEPSVVLKG